MCICVIDPVCQYINTELQCYVLDRNCTAYSNTGESDGSSGQNNVIYSISILGSVLVCLIIIMLCYQWRKSMKNKSKLTKCTIYYTHVYNIF